MKHFIVLVLALTFCVQARAFTADLSLLVDATGKVSADVQLTGSSNRPNNTAIVFEQLILALPFRVADSTRIQSPDDVPAAILKRGEGYTLISLAIPTARADSTIRFPEAFALSETAEGKASVELDLAYTFVSQTERQLLSSPFSVLPSTISITLPRDYDDRELGFSHAQIRRVNQRQYLLDVHTVTSQSGRIWLVFPNPMKSQLQIAKIIIGLVIGVFTLLIHVPALKEQKLSWSVTVLVISSVVFGLIIYYSFMLSKRLDFVEWAAGSAPHVIYGLVTSLYIVFVGRTQALITGRVTLDGQSIQVADVQLWRVVDGQPREDKQLDSLAAEVRYLFRVRPKSPDEQFQVTAATRGADNAQSDFFRVEAGKQIELKALNLRWKQQAVQTTGAAVAS